jgi:hypothetical protein
MPDELADEVTPSLLERDHAARLTIVEIMQTNRIVIAA